MKNFDEFSIKEEAVEPSSSKNEIKPLLRKRLDKLDVFETVEDIVTAIEQAGFNLRPKRSTEKSCDYAFEDPSTKYIYKSYTTGYIRTKNDEGTFYKPNAKDVGSPTTRARIPNVKDHLLFILRIALKIAGNRL